MSARGQEQFRQAACAGKSDFEDASRAHEVARRMRACGKAVQAYRCEYCGKWHIGAPKTARMRAER